jgi:LysR family transcriptional regulator for bpeEF and oprC
LRAVVLPSIADFHARHPHIELAVGVSSRTVDLVSDGVDCSIQLGNLPNSGLIARRLGDIERVTCASPAYLKQRGVPRTLDDLSCHVGIKCSASPNGYCMGFDFHVAGQLAKVKLDGFLQIDDEHGCLLAGLVGVGLLQLSRLAAEPYLRSGQLREVLPAWRPTPSPVSLVYLAGRQMSSRLRALVDWLSERFDENQRVEAVAPTVQRRMTVTPGGPGRSIYDLTGQPH